MKNGESTLGLFHGMFDRNILTFNPGLTNRMERLESFTDVRAIQSRLQAADLELATTVDAEQVGGVAGEPTDRLFQTPALPLADPVRQEERGLAGIEDLAHVCAGVGEAEASASR